MSNYWDQGPNSEYIAKKLAEESRHIKAYDYYGPANIIVPDPHDRNNDRIFADTGLLDTGADQSVVTLEKVQKWGLEHQIFGHGLGSTVGLGGHVEANVGRIMLDIEVKDSAGKTKRHSLQFTIHSSQMEMLILGTNALQKMNPIFDYGGKKWYYPADPCCMCGRPVSAKAQTVECGHEFDFHCALRVAQPLRELGAIPLRCPFPGCGRLVRALRFCFEVQTGTEFEEDRSGIPKYRHRRNSNPIVGWSLYDLYGA
jgi:hypothetical protein